MNVCFYFQVHQPFRLRHYPVFDIGQRNDYFDDAKNAEVMRKVADKCYLPTTTLLLELLNKHKEFKCAFSITGTALAQFAAWAPEVIENFQKLAKTGRVEFLAETSHHSLSFLFDRKEFAEQVKLHSKIIKQLFGQTPKVFRNTELIYSDELAAEVSKLGFKAVLAEGADHVLGWRSPNRVYEKHGVKLLLKNYKLSDDIAFRFSDKNWKEHPMTAPKFASWVDAAGGKSPEERSACTVNLFMDFETFGEHQWADTGIFKFLEKLPSELLKRNIGFHTPSEASKLKPVATLDMPQLVSWADVERDVSAWLGNSMQLSASHQLYALLPLVKHDKKLLEQWRKLSTSDHFYYMCTKWFADGDVHAYFNPYETPYDGFITFMNALKDLQQRTQQWVTT